MNTELITLVDKEEQVIGHYLIIKSGDKSFYINISKEDSASLIKKFDLKAALVQEDNVRMEVAFS